MWFLMIVNYKPVALKLQSLEMTFIRLLHLLAHHPDFALTEENISDIAKYVRLFICCRVMLTARVAPG